MEISIDFSMEISIDFSMEISIDFGPENMWQCVANQDKMSRLFKSCRTTSYFIKLFNIFCRATQMFCRTKHVFCNS